MLSKRDAFVCISTDPPSTHKTGWFTPQFRECFYKHLRGIWTVQENQKRYDWIFFGIPSFLLIYQYLSSLTPIVMKQLDLSVWSLVRKTNNINIDTHNMYTSKNPVQFNSRLDWQSYHYFSHLFILHHHERYL